MTLVKQNSRIAVHRTTTTGLAPTIPASVDFTDGTWINTDILVGEFFVNTTDDKAWFRTDNGIIEISTSASTSALWQRAGSDIAPVTLPGSPLVPPNIIIDSNQNIHEVGGAQIDFYSGELLLSNDNGGYGDSYIDLYNTEIDISSNGSTFSAVATFSSIASSIISLTTTDTAGAGTTSTSITQESVGATTATIELNVKDNTGGASQYGNGIYLGADFGSGVTGPALGTGLAGVFINSIGSSFNTGVTNSVIIGGTGITASVNDTVYVPSLFASGVAVTLTASTNIEMTTTNGTIKLTVGGSGKHINMNGASVQSTGALIVPRMTAANIASMTSVIEGMIVYDITNDKFKGYEAGAWVNLV